MLHYIFFAKNTPNSTFLLLRIRMYKIILLYLSSSILYEYCKYAIFAIEQFGIADGHNKRVNSSLYLYANIGTSFEKV